MSTVQNNNLDPYSAKAERTDVTPQQKITDLHGILKSTKTCMLTTRSADGQLHARAMIPTAPKSATQLSLIFIANNASHKFEELQNDAHVNVSFCDTSSTSWASFCGKARISQDKNLIKENWSTTVAGYFGDLKDGVHKGNAEEYVLDFILFFTRSPVVHLKNSTLIMVVLELRSSKLFLMKSDTGSPHREQSLGLSQPLLALPLAMQMLRGSCAPSLKLRSSLLMGYTPLRA
jgi:general stress protein 26